jgi:salicylate hydroxylase
MARITLQDMSDPRVIIVGCGIAGPVLALLLHEKGYKPTVVEKVKKLGDVGGSLMLQPNGYAGNSMPMEGARGANAIY